MQSWRKDGNILINRKGGGIFYSENESALIALKNGSQITVSIAMIASSSDAYLWISLRVADAISSFGFNTFHACNVNCYSNVFQESTGIFAMFKGRWGKHRVLCTAIRFLLDFSYTLIQRKARQPTFPTCLTGWHRADSNMLLCIFHRSLVNRA